MVTLLQLGLRYVGTAMRGNQGWGGSGWELSGLPHNPGPTSVCGTLLPLHWEPVPVAKYARTMRKSEVLSAEPKQASGPFGDGKVQTPQLAEPRREYRAPSPVPGSVLVPHRSRQLPRCADLAPNAEHRRGEK